MRVLVLGVLAALLLVPSASAWTWPADGDVLRAFSFSESHPYAAGQHRGIDVAGDGGNPDALGPRRGVDWQDA